MDSPEIVPIILIILGALFVVVLVVLRFRGVREIDLAPAGGSEAADASVEYQWEARSQGWFSLLALFGVIILIIVAVLWFLGYDWLDIAEKMPQAAIALVFAALSLITQGMRTHVYQMARHGVIRFDKQKPANKQLLFTWESIAWFKPDDHGFRYYIDPNKLDISAGQTVSMTGSGYVACGNHAMLVNSLMLARGVKTSPPES
jgi:hypothetical protein